MYIVDKIFEIMLEREEKSERKKHNEDIELISDSQKVLALFDIAYEKQFKIEEEFVDTYIYLLKTRGINFDYSFVFQPLPYSSDLRREILGLKMAGYLVAGSLIISKEGLGYVEKQKKLSYFRELLEKIGELTVDFIGYDRKALCEAVYAKII